MSDNNAWKVTALAPRATIDAALAAHERATGWDEDIVVAGSEVADDRPDEWRFEAWFPREPTAGDLAALAGLFADPAPALAVEALPDADWLVESQAGLEPIVAGAFRVRTPGHPPEPASGRRDLVIPAAQAFGTGQHATTAGCLEMLSALSGRGTAVASFADVGTGTGLLAFAALALWPEARAIASDIDPICAEVLAQNAALNAVALGDRAGELALVVADGLDHPALQARAPYDLIVANILAAPLIELAPAFAAALAQGGHLVLAGLLTTQEDVVCDACEDAGLAFAERLTRGDWSILRLTK
ncbi:MAG: 50S ribosomal protein L11 methyltransferase [Novosphingobium sp.]